MKNQYLVVFIASVFLVACTTTPRSNNYSYTETGRWIASAEDKANAKMSAMMFLTDQAVSSCEAVQKILLKIDQRNIDKKVILTLGDFKEALIEVDSNGIASLIQSPDCQNKINVLAQVMCDIYNITDGSLPLCEAVKLRREIDRYTVRLQTADAATAQRIKEELSEKFEELEQSNYQLSPSYGEMQRKGKIQGFMALIGVPLFLNPVAKAAVAAGVATVASGPAVAILSIALVLEGMTLLTSLSHALAKCKDTNIDRCRRHHFVRAHNEIWSGMLQAPAIALDSVISVFRKIFNS